MAIARGFVTEPVQFNLPVLQMPFEAAYQQMQQMQQSKDQFDELSAMMPKYLNQDADTATKYKGFVDSSVQAVSDAFARGDTSGAMRMLNTAKRELIKEWRPGGIADALQNRYTQAAEATKAIEEHTKDFTQPGYREYFQNDLQQQIERGIGYDPSSGRYNQISTPNLFGEVVVPDEVDKHLAGWKSDKGYSITKSKDGMWYYKETNEQVTPQELQSALQSFYQRPDINRALQVQAWNQVRQIPADQRPLYEAQLKDQMRSTFVEQLTDQQAQVNDLEGLLNSGKHTRQLQQELNRLGYDVPINGILDDETRAAAQGHIEQARADLTAATRNAEQVISNTSLQDLMLQKQRTDLTNAYVPKYSFTHKDVQMIANTPAIAMMKIRAQKQLLNSLTAQLQRPTPTLVAPVKAEVSQVTSIPVQYNNAKQNYGELEANLVGNLPKPFQDVLTGKQGTIPFGQGANATADFLRANTGNAGQPIVKRSNAVTQALQMAVSADNTQFDPSLYRQALDYQGVKLTDAEFQQHATLFSNRDNRIAMQRVNDQLLPAYAAVETTGDMYRDFSTAVENSNDVDWTAIAKNAGVLSREPSGTSELIGGLTTPKSDPVRAKQEFLRGNPRVIEEVTKWTKENNSSLIGNLEGVGNVDVIMNKDLEPFRKQYEELFKVNPLQAINRNEVDEATMNALGFDQNGSRLSQSAADRPKITAIEFGKRNVNGKSVLVGLVSTDKSDSPIVLAADQLNPQFLQEYVRNGAAATMNPNNVGEVMDPQAFAMFSSMYYDLENNGGTGYNANTITRMREQRQYGRIGIEVPTILGNEFTIETLLLPNQDGTQEYLVTVANSAIAKQILDYGIVTPEMQAFMDSSNEVNAVPLQPGYEGSKIAVDESKASLTQPFMMEEILTHPLKYIKSTNNLTPDAINIGASLMDF